MRELALRLAEGAPAPAFVAAGAGSREAVDGLRLSQQLEVVDNPAAAGVLVVAGFVPPALAGAVAVVHDALAHPRRTVHWPLGADQSTLPTAGQAVVIGSDAAAGREIGEAYRALLRGAVPSEPPLQPDEPPSPWQGVGPYGQGGTGMTGGTPYGRPLAEVADDRDGLRLDVLPLGIGPFFSPFPAGLTLQVSMAGDVVTAASVEATPYTPGFRVRTGLRPFVRALAEPVPIAELELARAVEHLRWAASSLRVGGLPALGMRVLRAVDAATAGDAGALRDVVGRLRRLRWLLAADDRRSPPADVLRGLGLGPVARAAGLDEDARTGDPAYAALGFEPIVTGGGDVAARWRQRLAEVEQSVDLMARAGPDARTTPTGEVESPRGLLRWGDAPFDRLLGVVPEVVEGREWGDAVSSIVSLDLDPEEAGAVRVDAAPDVLVA